MFLDGNVFDTTASTETLDTFIKCPDYHIDDYKKTPSGWLVYNQSVARQVKPGKRPIAERCNEKVIVSAADFDLKDIGLLLTILHYQLKETATSFLNCSAIAAIERLEMVYLHKAF